MELGFMQFVELLLGLVCLFVPSLHLLAFQFLSYKNETQESREFLVIKFGWNYHYRHRKLLNKCLTI